LSLTPSTIANNDIPGGRASFILVTIVCKSLYLDMVAKGDGV
jgi:hypothetical protein